jgi:hypothetical protein
MLSQFVLITLIPLLISPTGKFSVAITKPLMVAALVDSAKILGLPKFKLRDDKGNLYYPYKVMMQEPFALIYQHAGISLDSERATRRAFINAYVRTK